MEIVSMDIEFTSQGIGLQGVLHLPKTQSPPLVVGSHGLEGSKESAKQLLLATVLSKHGMAYLRFDHRGCGNSQGDFIRETSLEKRTQDLIDAVAHVLGLGLTSRRIGLFGSSMGGAACINAWNRIEKTDCSLSALVICSAPLKSLSIEKIPTAANDNRPALPLSFFAENLLFDLTDQAKDLSNILIFHGDTDDIVPVSNGKEIHRLARNPKQLVVHKNGDHQMTAKTDQQDFEKRTVQWFLDGFTT